ncbi:hypothetical protein [Amycolatopsis sp. DSM 110486]|uniref:hypothetical protein n=1 Tax=Amycolatopsis sp. DSM 110486 TaxID=2865832 RepID=UPI001C6A36C0|nr:hypothetical protein [Amycolatopsis sp. DSM 110486]QYN18948.1 hypothetical protein K1T34_40685 [Amycolatopsis sp. DSM 110486]
MHDDLLEEVRALFTDEELAEIAENKPEPGDNGKPDAIGLSRAWPLHVEKLDRDRGLPHADRSVWTEHDLAGALFMRDFVEDALRRLRPGLADKVRRYVTAGDDLFRSFTIDDPGDRIAKIARIDLAGRGWWWFRVPTSGPIVQDLAEY